MRKLTELLNQVSVYLMSVKIDDTVIDNGHNNLPEPVIDQQRVVESLNVVSVLDVPGVGELVIEPVSSENIQEIDDDEQKDKLFVDNVAVAASELVSIDSQALPSRALSVKNYFFGLLKNCLSLFINLKKIKKIILKKFLLIPSIFNITKF